MSFIDMVKDTLTTADFDVKGNMKVKTLQKNFSNSFGCELRIYNGKRFAENNHTIAKIRDSKISTTGEEFKIRASWTVYRLEKQFAESFGIKVQVALPENGGLAENSQTLGAVSRIENTTKGATMAETGVGIPLIIAMYIFVLALFVGFELITKVPPTLHTPLMSGANAISGITIIGAMVVVGPEDTTTAVILGFAALILATINVIGGFMVTDRMLQMFRRKPGEEK